jgi:ribosomal protein S18 acetylase RimI-like enzyme
VGARLLATAIEWSARRGLKRILLGTVDQFQAAQRFYEKHGFSVIPKSELPDHFPRMRLDTRFYQLELTPSHA